MTQSRFRNTFCVSLIFMMVCFVVPVYSVLAEDDIDACSGTVYDADGNAYGVVRVGDQCWLDRNMNVGTMLAGALSLPDKNDNKIEKWCLDNNPTQCSFEGGLYDWDEAMLHSTSEGAQGICPVGWHIPTSTEWYALEDFLKIPGEICDPNLIDVWKCRGDRGYGDYDSSTPNAGFYNKNYTLLWFSSRFDSTNAFFAFLSETREETRLRYAKNPVGLSIRCLKDTLDDPLTSLSIEIPKKSASVLSTTLPIAFTYKTTLPKSPKEQHSRIECAFV